jgi:Tat protein secretion system quality control protein TatD with DNase activity
VEVIDAIATAREEPVETVRETTAANARTAFPRLLEGPLGDQV